MTILFINGGSVEILHGDTKKDAFCEGIFFLLCGVKISRSMRIS